MSTTLAWTMGDRLRKSRESAGISREAMANELGLSGNTITNYERRPGKRGVPQTVIRIWAQVTEVDLEWLETGAGSHNG